MPAMRTRLPALLTVVALVSGAALLQSQQAAPTNLGIKYVRDSEEYATLARQVYRQATDAMTRAASVMGQRSWAAVLDIDETALDNSTYQLERASYGLPFDDASWNAWVNRREAAAVPGAVDFVAAVRRAGGHVAWISNRDASTVTATRQNLAAARLWHDDDRLCAAEGTTRPKRVRRAEVVSGQGACAWPGRPMSVLALVGDQMGDFPDADEKIPNTGTDAAFGATCFLLPNPMYGQWTSRVTRMR
jgi:5'-nucleotidase (lipoprotein e(P4) family)